jgi:hypothetical protein
MKNKENYELDGIAKRLEVGADGVEIFFQSFNVLVTRDSLNPSQVHS